MTLELNSLHTYLVNEIFGMDRAMLEARILLNKIKNQEVTEDGTTPRIRNNTLFNFRPHPILT